MTTTRLIFPRGEFSFIVHSAKSQRKKVFTHSFRVEYIPCSPTKVVLNLIELFPSKCLTVILFSCSKINLRRT